MSINLPLVKDNINYSLRNMLNLILDNHNCRKISKYYDNIYNFLEAFISDILYIDQYNKEDFNKAKDFILYKIKKMLEYINNIKNDTLKTIDMILKLNLLPVNTEKNCNNSGISSLFSEALAKENISITKELIYNLMTQDNINFSNIALQIEFIEIKLLDLFEKCLNNFTKIFIEYCILIRNTLEINSF
jgi:hypothetical protein